jgi:protein O-mannosyl-transferase
MKRSNEPQSLQAQRRLFSPWLAGATLVLLAAIVYWPTLDNGFVSDDDVYVENNVAIRSLQGLANIWLKFDTVEQYYPLVFSTYWVEYHYGGSIRAAITS